MSEPTTSAKRQEASLDLPLDPPGEGESKQSWVYRQIRERILKGALRAGARLPSTRSLAQRWRVSRSTVEAAYDQLRSEGYTAGAVGSGTYVAAVIPDKFFRRGPPNQEAFPAHVRVPAKPAPAEHVQDGLPFSSRSADAALLPMANWSKGLAASARRITPAQLGRDDPQGWLPLREQIARYLGAARGIGCDPDQVVVLSGIRDGLDLCGRILLKPQDRVLIEDPGYLNAVPVFSQYTPHVVPLAIDAQGFPVAQARRRRGVKLAYVTPAHQSPTGITMPVSRRLELLDWADQAGAWIVEDDYDSEFNYDGAPLAALKSMHGAERVIHCGSFNKSLFNALRIGYAVVPKALAAAFIDAQRRTGRSHSVIEQMTLARFLEDGGFARHIRKARGVYARRRDAALQALRHAVGADALRISGEHAGFHLLWWLPKGWEVARVVEAGRQAGVGVQPLAAFCRKAVLPPGVVIGYSAIDEDRLRRLGVLLADARPVREPVATRARITAV
ncbi:MocR-like pyridoxine biosynthesis transcription factor PdxR [Burkholderia stagnalis]